MKKNILITVTSLIIGMSLNVQANNPNIQSDGSMKKIDDSNKYWECIDKYNTDFIYLDLSDEKKWKLNLKNESHEKETNVTVQGKSYEDNDENINTKFLVLNNKILFTFTLNNDERGVLTIGNKRFEKDSGKMNKNGIYNDFERDCHSIPKDAFYNGVEILKAKSAKK